MASVLDAERPLEAALAEHERSSVHHKLHGGPKKGPAAVPIKFLAEVKRRGELAGKPAAQALRKAEARLDGGRWAPAAASLRECAALGHWDVSSVQYLLCVALARDGDAAGALRALDAACAERSPRPSFWLCAGKAYLLLGHTRPGQAQATLERCVELAPAERDERVALRHLRELRTQDEKASSNAHVQAGMALVSEAVELPLRELRAVHLDLVQRVERIDEDLRALVPCRTRKRDKAVLMAERASLELDLDTATENLNDAEAVWERAAEAFSVAVEFGCDDVDFARCERANCYYKLKRYDDAEVEWRALQGKRKTRNFGASSFGYESRPWYARRDNPVHAKAAAAEDAVVDLDRQWTLLLRRFQAQREHTSEIERLPLAFANNSPVKKKRSRDGKVGSQAADIRTAFENEIGQLGVFDRLVVNANKVSDQIRLEDEAERKSKAKRGLRATRRAARAVVAGKGLKGDRVMRRDVKGGKSMLIRRAVAASKSHDAALAKGEADKVKAAADKKKRLEAAKYAKAEAAYTGSQHAAKVMNANFG